MTPSEINRINQHGTLMQRDLLAAWMPYKWSKTIGFQTSEKQDDLIRYGRFVSASCWREMQNDPFLTHLWADTPTSSPQHPATKLS